MVYSVPANCAAWHTDVNLVIQYLFVETLVSLSSSTYISHESDHQVTVSVTSSTTSLTDFVIELHSNPITALGINFLQ